MEIQVKKCNFAQNQSLTDNYREIDRITVYKENLNCHDYTSRLGDFITIGT